MGSAALHMNLVVEGHKMPDKILRQGNGAGRPQSTRR